jgi:hypothetical protein
MLGKVGKVGGVGRVGKVGKVGKVPSNRVISALEGKFGRVG